MEAVKLPFKEITTPQRSNLAKILEEKPDDLIALALDQIQQPLARETVIDSQPKQPLLNASFVTDPLSANAANIQSTAGSSSDSTNHPATPGHGYLLARSSQIGGPHPRPVFPRHPLGRDRYRQDDALSPNRGNPADSSSRPPRTKNFVPRAPILPDHQNLPAPWEVIPSPELPPAERKRVVKDLVDGILRPHMLNPDGMRGNPMTRKGNGSQTGRSAKAPRNGMMAT